MLKLILPDFSLDSLYPKLFFPEPETVSIVEVVSWITSRVNEKSKNGHLTFSPVLGSRTILVPYLVHRHDPSSLPRLIRSGE